MILLQNQYSVDKKLFIFSMARTKWTPRRQHVQEQKKLRNLMVSYGYSLGSSEKKKIETAILLYRIFIANQVLVQKNPVN